MPPSVRPSPQWCSKFIGAWITQFQVSAPPIFSPRWQTPEQIVAELARDNQYKTHIESEQGMIRAQVDRIANLALQNSSDPHLTARSIAYQLCALGHSREFLYQLGRWWNDYFESETTERAREIEACVVNRVFSIAEWKKRWGPRTFECYFFVPSLRQYKSSLPVVTKKVATVSEVVAQSFAREAKIPLSAYQFALVVNVKTVDIQQAVLLALEAFEISKAIRNALSGNSPLDLWTDASEIAVCNDVDHSYVIPIKWKFTGLLITRPRVEVSRPGALMREMAGASGTCLGQIRAYTDCFDLIMRYDKRDVLLRLTTSLDLLFRDFWSLIDAEEQFRAKFKRLGPPAAYNAHVGAKILALLTPQDMYVDLIADASKHERASGRTGDGWFKQLRGVAISSLASRLVTPVEIYKAELLRQFRNSFRQTTVAVATRYQCDLLRAIKCRNALVHTNIDHSSPYLIRVLLLLSRVMLELRIRAWIVKDKIDLSAADLERFGGNSFDAAYGVITHALLADFEWTQTEKISFWLNGPRVELLFKGGWCGGDVERWSEQFSNSFARNYSTVRTEFSELGAVVAFDPSQDFII